MISLFCDASSLNVFYTLSLHDALPISSDCGIRTTPYSIYERLRRICRQRSRLFLERYASIRLGMKRSEEHTSELQSRGHLVCRLLLEKKNYINTKFKCIYTNQ